MGRYVSNYATRCDEERLVEPTSELPPVSRARRIDAVLIDVEHGSGIAIRAHAAHGSSEELVDRCRRHIP